MAIDQKTQLILDKYFEKFKQDIIWTKNIYYDEYDSTIANFKTYLKDLAEELLG